MKKIYRIIIVMAAAFAVCGCLYDDSYLTERIDDFKNRIEALKNGISEMNASIEALGELTGGNVITSVMKDSDGNYVISYLDGSGSEKSVIVATASQMLNVPVLGVQLDPQTQIYWWTVTDSEGNTSFLMIDGKKVPVSGNAPEISVNDDGYWTVSGEVLKDSKGNPIEAKDGESCIFRSVSVNADGNLEMVLGNGKTVTLPVQNAFNLTLSAVVNNTVSDASVPVVFSYDVSGSNADGAIVAVAKAEGLDASMDRENKRVTVTFPEGFASGMLIMVGYDLADHTVIRPLFFDKASSDMIEIATAEDLVRFAEGVNARNGMELMKACLTADIDMASVKDWTPIGNGTYTTGNVISGASYKGDFDGRGHSVKNLKVSVSVDAPAGTASGLFGILQDASVKNLKIDRSCSFSSSAAGMSAMGAVAGYVYASVIEDCTCDAVLDFDGGSDNVRTSIGGVAGALCCIDGTDALVSGCVFSGRITSVNASNTKNGGTGISIGGIAGFSDALGTPANFCLVSGCTNNGTLDVQATRTAGIIASMNKYSKTENCVNNGAVTCTDVTASNSRVAGIVSGMGTKTSLYGCINNGDVTFAVAGDRTHGYAGGVVGQTNDAVFIDACGNYGAVRSDMFYAAEPFMGIIVGNFNSKAATVSNCKLGGSIGPYSEEPTAITEENFGRYLSMAVSKAGKAILDNNTFAGSQDTRKGISTAEDLLAFAAAVNSGDAEALAEFYDGDFTVNLLADIDCSSVTEWVPAGNAAHPFCGRFNGDGHKIRNLAMSFRGAGNVYGFFGNVGPGAVIENFVLGEGCSLTVSPSQPINCGTVAGVVSDAVIRDIESHAPIVFKESSITASSVRSAIGMIGSVTSAENSPVIENLVNFGNVSVVENANTESGGNCVHVAGVVAYANGKSGCPVLVRNCANHGDLNTTVARVSGIIAGPNAWCSVSGCVNRGNVFNRHKKTGAGRLGNICCNLGNGVELTGCINYGDIVSASADRCGGICGNVGNATAVLSGCENYGRVISDEKTYRGTICGYFAQNIKVSSCIAQGDVGSYNGGAYQMEGVNSDNYFDYVGAVKSGCEHVSPMNIWWSADSVTAGDEFGTEPSEVSFTYTGGTALTGLSSKTWDWTVSSSDSWLSLVDGSGAEIRGGGMNASVQRLYVKAGLNMTSSVRTGTLTFSSVDGTQTAAVNVSQSPALAADASKWVFTSTGTGKYTDFWTSPSHIIPATDGTSGTISAVRGEANAMVPFTYSVSSGKPYVGTLVKDDCLLFSMPVEGLEAGTWFQFNAIIGSKTNAHKYFVLEYLDGGQWKSVEGNLRTASEDASLKYTFMNSGVQSGTDYQHASVFQMFRVENALAEGTLEVRLRAVGTYTCSGITESVSNTSADIFIPAFGFSGAYCSKIGKAAPKVTRRVLALGNSFSYYNNPLWYLQEIAAREGNFVDLQGHVKGSQNLSQHAALSLSDEVVGLGGYDFAFLQDQSENPAIYALSGTASICDAAVALADKVRSASPSCRVIIENTWSFNGKAGSYGGTLASFDGYLASGTKAMAQAASAWVSPIGQAFARCRELYPSVNLYHTDNKHQSAYGAYLKACVNYLVLFGERFSDTPADCGINPQVAADLRGIAEEIVLGHEQDYLIVR